MKLATRIFCCYFAIFAVCFYYPIDWIRDTLRTRYLEGVEDPLVDQAHMLAALVGDQMKEGRFDPKRLHRLFADIGQRPISAPIYQVVKDRMDASVYITDTAGQVIFHSADEDEVGQDYSRWRDVRLTLAGGYGARTTLSDPEDPTSSVLYVAAPVWVDGHLAGVLTVVKPTTTIQRFLKNAKPQVFRIGLMAALAAMFLGYLVSLWITWPIKRLTRYAQDIKSGRRVHFPRLDSSEIGQMGAAFEQMQDALEGKRYVEHYVQNLTHELKSPLSAIRGAAELLAEPMPDDRRARFLANIRNETGRIQDLVDRMLELAALESRKQIETQTNVSIRSLLKAVLESKQPLIEKKRISVSLRIVKGSRVTGDPFLLQQAIGNLLQNAIDFSPVGGRIDIWSERPDDGLQTLHILDEGPGIPEFARSKVFDKFFSLQRPDSQKKSTGLGLNFVREVAHLHHGRVVLRCEGQKGTHVSLCLP